jgi:hypothetical protein
LVRQNIFQCFKVRKLKKFGKHCPGGTQAALGSTPKSSFTDYFFICGDANSRRKRTAGLLNKLCRQNSEIKTEIQGVEQH